MVGEMRGARREGTYPPTGTTRSGVGGGVVHEMVWRGGGWSRGVFDCLSAVAAGAAAAAVVVVVIVADG